MLNGGKRAVVLDMPGPSCLGLFLEQRVDSAEAVPDMRVWHA